MYCFTLSEQFLTSTKISHPLCSSSLLFIPPPPHQTLQFSGGSSDPPHLCTLGHSLGWLWLMYTGFCNAWSRAVGICLHFPWTTRSHDMEASTISFLMPSTQHPAYLAPSLCSEPALHQCCPLPGSVILLLPLLMSRWELLPATCRMRLGFPKC